MARGLSNSIKTELANQNINPILLVEILNVPEGPLIEINPILNKVSLQP